MKTPQNKDITIFDEILHQKNDRCSALKREIWEKGDITFQPFNYIYSLSE